MKHIHIEKQGGVMNLYVNGKLQCPIQGFSGWIDDERHHTHIGLPNPQEFVYPPLDIEYGIKEIMELLRLHNTTTSDDICRLSSALSLLNVKYNNEKLAEYVKKYK